MTEGEKLKFSQRIEDLSLNFVGDIENEFQELKDRWDNFIAQFKTIAPAVYSAKANVFYELESPSRPKKVFVEMARNTRPIISIELWNLLETFMEIMRKLPGVEGENYRVVYEGMTPAGLVKRLLTKRPIVFVNRADYHVLREKPKDIVPAHDKWNSLALNLDEIQDAPFLREYISYDEMLISACVSMSTPTFYVSDGSLKSPTEKSSKPFVPEGILCGLVGARLPKIGFMEHRFLFPRHEPSKPFYQLMLTRDKSKEEFNRVHHSDDFWIKHVCPEAFPEGKIPTEKEVRNKASLYQDIYKDGINIVYFKKRLSFSIIPYLKEAENRGLEKNRQVMVSVPPIGAGVWRGSVDSKIIHQLILNIILEYLDNDFDVKNLDTLVAIFPPGVDLDVYINFVPCEQILSINVDETTSKVSVAFKGKAQKLTIFNETNRRVASLPPAGFESCLSVSAYAWDGNSYPGNEYWVDSFYSFDPQAVICSLLGQFQNPEVNIHLADPERIKCY